MDSITLQEIVTTLNSKGSRRRILFLGSKAGIFFENETLYDKVKGYSVGTFQALHRTEKFRTCYHILEEHFTEVERHQMLSQSSSSVPTIRLEDSYLAKVIKAGYFQVILSTNIDLLLEDALRREGISLVDELPREGESLIYQLLIYTGQVFPTLKPTQGNLVFKIFGDLESNKYQTAGDEILLEKDGNLRESVECIVDGDVVMVGYDPIWDGPLDSALFPGSGSLIYINDIAPEDGAFITRLIRKRRGKCLVGEQGSYRRFMQDLCTLLVDPGPLNYETNQEVSRLLQQLHDDMAQIKQDIASLRQSVGNEFSLIREALQKLESIVKSSEDKHLED